MEISIQTNKDHNVMYNPRWSTMHKIQVIQVIISPNEVFGDIMVLASPPRPPPVDPDDVNTLTRKIFMWIGAKNYQIWLPMG